MVYKFRIVSNEKEDFFRDIEIDAENNFYELHKAIQNSVNYDTSFLATFFVSNNKWEKLQEITLMDMSENDQNLKPVMHQTKLNEFIKDKKDKVLYIYDMFSERAFFIELVNVKKREKNKEYPVLINGNGKAPIQSLMNDFPIFSNEFDDENF